MANLLQDRELLESKLIERRPGGVYLYEDTYRLADGKTQVERVVNIWSPEKLNKLREGGVQVEGYGMAEKAPSVKCPRKGPSLV